MKWNVLKKLWLLWREKPQNAVSKFDATYHTKGRMYGKMCAALEAELNTIPWRVPLVLKGRKLSHTYTYFYSQLFSVCSTCSILFRFEFYYYLYTSSNLIAKYWIHKLEKDRVLLMPTESPPCLGSLHKAFWVCNWFVSLLLGNPLPLLSLPIRSVVHLLLYK